ncbi:MAG: CHAT domain-containing protein [Theionarchaea archaeon]|nr:CHAT domain-containing protein [Theionarchaea archaeon]
MNFLEIRDIGNGQVQITWQRGNTVRPCLQPLPFEDPLTLEDKKELRWYLEDYLRFPYGAEEWHAQEVEKKMAAWGESLFNQVFSKCDFDPDPRALYQEAVREGLDTCELCIVSEDTDFLNIPWELLRDPTPGRGYLAPLLKGFYRKRTGVKLEFPPLSSDEPFRILLVIARPFGERDISFSTIARPMLEALRPLRPYVKLEVLRPPTFDALVKTLNTKRGHYHLVHFDGHGVFARPSGSIMQFGSGGKGYLVFEKEDGTEDTVSSDRLGQALATCRVPLFILNACQSAEEGKTDSYASVASQLVAVGAKGVVAMSYSVYGVAASKFMERFYETLINHASLSEAVAQARLKLYADADRVSLVGERKLQDWMVPTLYQQEYDYVPIQEYQYTGEEPLIDMRKKAEEVCPEGKYGFIGRDYDILRIERCLLNAQKPLVILTGLGGSGKTELAYGFARWYAETEGCPGGVFATSFREKGDFGQVVGSIAGYGTDFSRLPDKEQWQFLIQYLRDNPCLLIWDNFETVKGYPEGAVPLATDAEREKLSLFLKALKNGKTRVIITTRKPHEDWLGIAYTLIEVGGLTERDAGQLAKSILETVGRRPEDFKDDPEYSRLLTLLRGHPRSLEVVLPHLRRKSPSQIIEALQHRIDEFGDVMDASLQYAFVQLSDQAQKHLPLVGLFTSYVNEGVLSVISNESVYEEIIGESLDAAGWKKILEEAASVGLIRPVSGVNELHPTFPSFLRQKMISAVGKDGLDRLDTVFLEFYGGFAAHIYERLNKGDLDVLTPVSIEEPNFLRALHLAEMNDLWANAQYIVGIIGEFYKIRGRTSEWAALRTRLLSWTGQEMSKDADPYKAHLLMYLLGNQADDVQEKNELETAEECHQRILAYLHSLNDERVEPNIAVAYNNLGRIAEERQQFDEAEQWYRKALEIYERLKLERDAADDYHQLGIIAQDAQERQQFYEAEQWYRKALEIYEGLGHPPYKVNTLGQLGILYREKNQLHDAMQYFGEAFSIAAQYGMKVLTQILVDLARIMETMGEEDFTDAWKKEFAGQEPPIALIRETMEKLEL